MDRKVLSIRNPISYMVAIGAKRVENRSWSTSYRGKLWIHSSGKARVAYDDIPQQFFPPSVYEQWLYYAESEEGREEPIENIPSEMISLLKFDCILWDYYGEETDHTKWTKPPFCISQAIIGSVNLVDIIKDADSPYAEPGYHHWILENPSYLKSPSSL